MSLRPYQHDAIRGMMSSIDVRRNVLLVMPTGSGKTRTASTLVANLIQQGHSVLWIAHRIELVEQAHQTMASIGVDSSIIAPGFKTIPGLVTIASLQTLARRQTELSQTIMVVDEAHHITSTSYEKIIARMPQATVVGLTATPTRLDGRGLADIFKDMVEPVQVTELIGTGHLVAPRVFTTPVLPDMKGARKTGGDYNQADIETRVNQAKIRGDIIRHWRERASTHSTVLFASSIAHSHALISDFRDAGVTAEHIDGSTSYGDRMRILENVKSGRTRVLSNVGIVTEGWDFPKLGCCILARPTMSLSLLVQMVGRVMRPHPEKAESIVLDHAGNMILHSYLPWENMPWSLESAKTKRPELAPMRSCPSCFAIHRAAMPTCPQCGHVYESKPRALDTETSTELVDISTLNVEVPGMLRVMSYVTKKQRKGETLSRFAKTLIEKLQSGKLPPEFTPYLEQYWGNIGRAAFEYKQELGKWP